MQLSIGIYGHNTFNRKQMPEIRRVVIITVVSKYANNRALKLY